MDKLGQYRNVKLSLGMYSKPGHMTMQTLTNHFLVHYISGTRPCRRLIKASIDMLLYQSWSVYMFFSSCIAK